ncbi:MAG: 2-oxoacid:ferredoxin oxidoreductase subunit gamma [Clostridiales bacterium GWF2_38_85]|nr:MAG: 2-oxoacid:ferredoxin oxidoreductase subunit gamma [Clostridiales bacterium GWF2_38_85]
MSNFLFAGFGGQGILFSGKLLAKVGLELDKQVSWLPSYGPEMRGGTANCSVIVNDEPIGSPLVTKPDVLLVLNLPSFEKFEHTVIKNGIMIVDSSLVEKKTVRTDIKAYYIPASMLASDNDLAGLANIIMFGQMLKAIKLFDYSLVEAVLVHSTPKSKPQLAELNKKALSLGYNYQA